MRLTTFSASRLREQFHNSHTIVRAQFLARPKNIAFGGPANEYLYVTNLGRWHINRVHLGISGQLLANQR
jgi:hypothetical protein